MDGLYLYCLREKIKNSPAISAKGIDGKGEVFVLPCRQLEAVVSRISMDEFGSEEIQRKAREDLNWIKEKGIAHEKVIEEAMTSDGKVLSVIPMRFGTIFEEEAKLKEIMNNAYLRIRKVLESIRDKQEWSVKLYLMDRKKLEQAIREKNEAIKEKEKELASLPEGMAFFMEEELKRLIAEEVDKELCNVITSLFGKLSARSVASSQSKILAMELTGRREPMVLNSAFLVSEQNVESFKKEVEELREQVRTRGFCLEYSGPWPAFNFTSF